jgi:hypothetical protein
VKKTILLFAVSLAVLSVAACSREQPSRQRRIVSSGSAGEEGDPMAEPAHGASNPATSSVPGVRGTVIETVNAANYTYVQVDTGSEKIWAAAPQFAVKVGDRVVVPEGMPMRNYHSKTLNRDFPLVSFVGSVLNETTGGSAKGDAMPGGHAPAAASAAAPQIDVSGVKKAEGGATVGEIYAQKDSLSGKEVTLRAKVVKFNAQIMGKNWLHVQDGSGEPSARTNDLTVTTGDTAAIGDTVLVRGKLALNKDFGAGYRYDVIVEDAKVTRQ